MSISVIDRNQLFDDWPSGYGVREVISYLREQSKEQKIVIGTEGTFGSANGEDEDEENKTDKETGLKKKEDKSIAKKLSTCS